MANRIMGYHNITGLHIHWRSGLLFKDEGKSATNADSLEEHYRTSDAYDGFGGQKSSV